MVPSRVLCFMLVAGIGYFVDGYRILGIFPAASKSHYSIGKSLLQELANRGHDVTMVGPFRETSLPANFRSIQIEFKMDTQGQKVSFFSKEISNPYLVTSFLYSMADRMLDNILKHSEIKKLLNSKEKFDAVIMDQFVIEGFAYFAHHFGANQILVTTSCTSHFVNPLVGNTAPPSAVADFMMDFPSEMTFYQRLQNTMYFVFTELANALYHFPKQNKVLQENVPGSKPLYDYLYNVSLLLANGHESFCESVPQVPVVKNVGGLHITKAGELPSDLQEFMDNSKNGVIYFSLGSNLKSADLPIPVRNSILKVFSKLNINILWKWEDEILPGQPSNVKLSKWFPQKELLAHPNIKLFITHGGLLSTIEAIHFGVPLLALPVYGDQKYNAANAARMGFAISLPFHEFDEAEFEAALRDMLTNSKYKENVLRRSGIYHDRPRKPIDEAIYWVEYVIRHRGAEHLRVAALKLSWYQYLLLDVTAFIFGVVLSIIFIVKLLVRKVLCRKCTKNIKNKTE